MRVEKVLTIFVFNITGTFGISIKPQRSQHGPSSLQVRPLAQVPYAAIPPIQSSHSFRFGMCEVKHQPLQALHLDSSQSPHPHHTSL